MKYPLFTVGFLLVAAIHVSAQEKDAALAKQALQTMKKATHFFRTKVSAGGGYLWRYSADLKLGEGEGKAHATTVWVQPPGTPSVGFAYLRAYAATRDAYFLESAREVALALVKGQLQSGGWDYRIEFDPQHRVAYAYRVAPNNAKGKNVTTLDDNNTQEAADFLMHVDQALGFKDKTIHEAAEYALACLLKAQYPNGAWPQRYADFPDPAKYPVKKANYPASWPREHPAKNYSSYYTLNDNTLADMIALMFDAGRIYKEERYRQAALKGGDFLILAQMPEPQPAWAQQYDLDMHPAWARKFEPPAITGGESQGVLRTLLKIYRETGDKKYLAPVPQALAYFKKVQLPNGQLARFYELKTSKPLYFTKQYQLTYADDDLPTHYGFKVGSKIDAIAKEYNAVLKLDPAKLKPSTDKKPASPPIQRVKDVIAALDEQGRWIEQGKLKSYPDALGQKIISCQTFIQNMDTLSAYIGASSS